MQSSIVLYGWLMVTTKNFIYKILMIVLLIGIALSLVYCNYHNYFDILGAIFFGCLLIFFCKFLANSKKKILLAILLTFSTLLLLYILLVHKVIEQHLWMAYYTLIGVVFSEYLFGKEGITINLRSKIIASIVCFIMLFIKKILFLSSYMSSLPIFFKQIPWVVIGFCIPWSIFLATYINGIWNKYNSF